MHNNFFEIMFYAFYYTIFSSGTFVRLLLCFEVFETYIFQIIFHSNMLFFFILACLF